MTFEMLKKSLLEAPVVKKGDYFYVVHPITDGIPEIKPELLDEVVNEMQKRIEKCAKIDKIVTMEAMGIPLATALSSRMNIPFVIIRKRSYGLPGEYVVEQKTGYSKSNLYINGLDKGDEIVIVDDVLSTGGTLKIVLSTLKKIGVTIKGIFIVVDKGNIAKKIMDESKVNIDVIVNIEVIDGRVVIKNI
jgi:adenine phosphoribosyltransferase